MVCVRKLYNSTSIKLTNANTFKSESVFLQINFKGRTPLIIGSIDLLITAERPELQFVMTLLKFSVRTQRLYSGLEGILTSLTLTGQNKK